MKLICLGTAGYHPSKTRHTSCFFLPELGLQLDAGSGTFRMAQYNQKDSIDVWLSHAHLDHVLGLTYFLGLCSATKLKSVRVHGDPTHLEAIQSHLLSAQLFPAKLPIEWIPFDNTREREIGGARLSWFPLAHPGGCWGLRILVGTKTLCYITDTTATPNADYLEYLRDVDLLIHECNFPDSMKDFAIATGHSWLSNVLEVAIQSRAKKLLLVHFSPYLDDVDPIGYADTFKNFDPARLPEVIIARDLQKIEF